MTDFGGACPPPPLPGLVKDSPQQNFALAVTIITPILMVGFIAVFWYFKEDSVYLRKRSLTLLIWSFVASLLALATTSLYDYLGSEMYPCWLYMLICYAASPAFNLSGMIITLRYSNEVAALKLKQSVQAKNNNEQINVQPEVSMRTFRAFIGVSFLSKKNEEDRILNAKFARTNASIVFWSIFMVFPYPLAYFIRLGLNPQWVYCTGCEISLFEAIYFLLVNSFGLMLATSANSYKVQRRDALRFVREWIMVWWWTGAIVTITYILFITDPGQTYTNGAFNFRILLNAATLLSIYLQTVHQVMVSRQLKRQLLLMPQINFEERFEDVMHDKTLQSKFRSFLDTELSGEILQFLDAVQDFKQTFEKEGAQRRARVILDNFIQRNAPQEVNLGSDIRFRLIEKLTVGNVPVDVFDEAYATVKKSLLVDGFARFIQKIGREQNAPGSRVPSNARTYGSQGVVTPTDSSAADV